VAVTLPKGFSAAGGKAGIKASGRLDLALLVSTRDLAWALTSTQNRLKAPCVTRNRARFLSGEAVRAVVISSGNANCATGEAGVWDNEALAEAAAEALGITPQQVLTASTGVVGHKLPIEKLQASIPGVAQRLGDNLEAAAHAILTTDLVPKVESVTLPGGARITGIAKGSGMIHPMMATMLAFVMTDAIVSQEALRALWPRVVDKSFNQVTVDGDTSPNDMAIALASGFVATETSELERGLLLVAQGLAQRIARDGEGATKLITVRVSGARSEREAREAARTVARSPLVKAAAHGNDPNWGRILIAAGYSGVTMDVANARVALQGEVVFHGTPKPFDEAALSAKMKGKDLLIEVDLAVGDAEGLAWGCDLSREYVAINADYTT
jgi:glutamate N-acetyltransferase/amino-acid N-acetyltransferase